MGDQNLVVWYETTYHQSPDEDYYRLIWNFIYCKASTEIIVTEREILIMVCSGGELKVKEYLIFLQLYT